MPRTYAWLRLWPKTVGGDERQETGHTGPESFGAGIQTGWTKGKQKRHQQCHPAVAVEGEGNDFTESG